MNQLDSFYEEVKKIAYYLFEKRGRMHGYDMADWLEAEMIVKKRYERKADQAPPVAATSDGKGTGKGTKTKPGT